MQRLYLRRRQEKIHVRFFSRKSRALKNWHTRAMLIDPKKTKIILLGNEEIKRVPPWVYKKFAAQQSDEENY